MLQKYKVMLLGPGGQEHECVVTGNTWQIAVKVAAIYAAEQYPYPVRVGGIGLI